MMHNLIKKTIEEVTSSAEDRTLCDDPADGEFFCLAGSENLGVTDIYKGDGFDIIHQHGGQVHLSDISPEEEETVIPKGSKKVKKTIHKPRLNKEPFNITPINLSEGWVVTPIKIDGKMVSGPNHINEETDIFGQGLLDPIEPEEFEGEEEEWEKLLSDVEELPEPEPEYEYVGGKTDPSTGFVAPSAEVTNNICKVKGFCTAQGPITFGQLRELVEAATSKRIQADMGRGVFKTLWRVIPFFIPQVLLAAVGITVTRAINKIITPALTDTRGYKSWWGKAVLKAMDIAEGDYIPDRALGDDPLSKIFFISDGLLQMIRDKYKLKFARYVAEVASNEPDNKPVPEWFVENLLRDYLNQKFLLDPPLPIKHGVERQSLQEQPEQDDAEDGAERLYKQHAHDNEDYVDNSPFTPKEVSILKALHKYLDRSELQNLSQETPEAYGEVSKKFWDIMKIFGITPSSTENNTRESKYAKWALDNWTEEGDYGNIETPIKVPLKWYDIDREESGSQIEYKSGNAEVLGFDEDDASDRGDYNFWDWGGEMETDDYGDYESYDSEITNSQFIRMDEGLYESIKKILREQEVMMAPKDKKILDLTPQIFGILDENFVIVPYEDGELNNGEENLALYSFDHDSLVPLENIYNPIKPLLDGGADREDIDVFIKIITEWINSRMFPKPNYDLNESLNDLIYSDEPNEKHIKRMGKDWGILSGFPIDRFKNTPPPQNESGETEEEIKHLESLPVDSSFIKSADDVDKLFKNFLITKGEEYPTDEIKNFMRGVRSIILQLKYYYNRPRPGQVADAKGMDFDPESLKSASTPSYPSGHATQGRFISRYLSEIYPQYKEELMKIGDDIAFSRNMAKVHYPSDSKFGQLLGDALYDYVGESQMEVELDEWCPMGNPNKCKQVNYKELPDTLHEQINKILQNSFGQKVRISLAESFFLKKDKIKFNTLGFNLRYFQPIRKNLKECKNNFETLLVEMKEELNKSDINQSNLTEEVIRELIIRWYPKLLEQQFPFNPENKKKAKTHPEGEPDWSIRRGRQHYAMNVEDTQSEPVTALNNYLVKNSPFNFIGFDYYLSAVPDSMPNSARVDVFVPMLDTGRNADKLWSGERIRYYEDLGIDDFDYDYEEETESPYIIQNPVLHDIPYNQKYGEHYDHDSRFRDDHPEDMLKYENRESEFLNEPGAAYEFSWRKRFTDLKNEMEEIGKLFGVERILINRYPDRPWSRQQDSYGNENIRPGKTIPRGEWKRKLSEHEEESKNPFGFLQDDWKDTLLRHEEQWSDNEKKYKKIAAPLEGRTVTIPVKVDDGEEPKIGITNITFTVIRPSIFQSLRGDFFDGNPTDKNPENAPTVIRYDLVFRGVEPGSLLEELLEENSLEGREGLDARERLMELLMDERYEINESLMKKYFKLYGIGIGRLGTIYDSKALKEQTRRDSWQEDKPFSKKTHDNTKLNVSEETLFQYLNQTHRERLLQELTPTLSCIVYNCYDGWKDDPDNEWDDGHDDVDFDEMAQGYCGECGDELNAELEKMDQDLVKLGFAQEHDREGYDDEHRITWLEKPFPYSYSLWIDGLVKEINPRFYVDSEDNVSYVEDRMRNQPTLFEQTETTTQNILFNYWKKHGPTLEDDRLKLLGFDMSDYDERSVVWDNLQEYYGDEELSNIIQDRLDGLHDSWSYEYIVTNVEIQDVGDISVDIMVNGDTKVPISQESGGAIDMSLWDINEIEELEDTYDHVVDTISDDIRVVLLKDLPVDATLYDVEFSEPGTFETYVEENEVEIITEDEDTKPFKVEWKNWDDLMSNEEYYKIVNNSDNWPTDVVDHMENNLPMTLRKELALERQGGLSASHGEPEWFKSMTIDGGKNAKPTLIKVEDLLKNDKTTHRIMSLSPQEDLDLINKRYGTNYKTDIVHDPDPGRVQRYSEFDGGTAAPSIMIDGEINFGVGRVKAAILRGDDYVRVWDIKSNQSLGFNQFYDARTLNEHGADDSWSDDDDTVTLQDILELTKDIKIIDYPTKELAPKVLGWKDNPEEIERISQVEVSRQYPILIMVNEYNEVQWVLDGNHRAQQALINDIPTIPAKLIKPSDLDERSIKMFYPEGIPEPKEDYFTGSKFGDDEGNEFDVETIYEYVKSNGDKYLKKNISIDGKLKHNFKWWENKYDINNPEHKERMMNSDTSFPILVVIEKDGNWAVSDGLNRLYKAKHVERKDTIDGYVISKEEILDQHIGQLNEHEEPGLNPELTYGDTILVIDIDKERENGNTMYTTPGEEMRPERYVPYTVVDKETNGHKSKWPFKYTLVPPIHLEEYEKSLDRGWGNYGGYEKLLYPWIYQWISADIPMATNVDRKTISEHQETKVSPDLEEGDIIRVIGVDGEHARMPDRWGVYVVKTIKQDNATQDIYYDIDPYPEVELPDSDYMDHHLKTYGHPNRKTLYRGDTWIYADRGVGSLYKLRTTNVDRKTISEHKESKLNPELMMGDEIMVVSTEGIHDFGAPELYKPYVVVGIKHGTTMNREIHKWTHDEDEEQTPDRSQYPPELQARSRLGFRKEFDTIPYTYYQIEPIGITDEERTGAMLAGGGRMKPMYIFPSPSEYRGRDQWILRPGFLRGELNEHKESKTELNPKLKVGDEIIVVDVKEIDGRGNKSKQPEKYIRYFVTKIYHGDEFHRYPWSQKYYGLNRPDVDVTDPERPGVYDRSSIHKYLFPADTWMFNPKGPTMRYEDAFLDDDEEMISEQKQEFNQPLTMGDVIRVVDVDKESEYELVYPSGEPTNVNRGMLHGQDTYPISMELYAVMSKSLYRTNDREYHHPYWMLWPVDDDGKVLPIKDFHEIILTDKDMWMIVKKHHSNIPGDIEAKHKEYVDSGRDIISRQLDEHKESKLNPELMMGDEILVVSSEGIHDFGEPELYEPYIVVGIKYSHNASDPNRKDNRPDYDKPFYEIEPIGMTDKERLGRILAGGGRAKPLYIFSPADGHSGSDQWILRPGFRRGEVWVPKPEAFNEAEGKHWRTEGEQEKGHIDVNTNSMTPGLQKLLKITYAVAENSYPSFNDFSNIFEKYFGRWNSETLGTVWLTLVYNADLREISIPALLDDPNLPNTFKVPTIGKYIIEYKDDYTQEEWDEECDDDGYGERSEEDCHCTEWEEIEIIKKDEDGERFSEWKPCDEATSDELSEFNEGDCNCDEWDTKYYDVYAYPTMATSVLALVDPNDSNMSEYYTYEEALEELGGENGAYVTLEEGDSGYEDMEYETWEYFRDDEQGEILEWETEYVDVEYEFDYLNKLVGAPNPVDKPKDLSEQDEQLNLFPTGDWEFPVGWDEDDDYRIDVKTNVPEPVFKKIMQMWDKNGIDFSIFKLLGISHDSVVKTFVLKRYIQNTTKPIPVSMTYDCNDLKELFDRSNSDYDLSYIEEYLCGDESFWDSEEWYNYEWDSYMTDAIDENNWKTISEIFGGVSQSDAEDILNRSSSSEEVDELIEKYEEEIDEIQNYIVWAHNDEHEYAVKNGMAEDIEDKIADHFQSDGHLHTDNNGSKSWTIEGDLRDYVNDVWDNTEDVFEYHPDHLNQILEDFLMDFSSFTNAPDMLFKALMDEEYAFWDYCEGKKGECLQPDTKFFDGYWDPNYDINGSLEDRLAELTYEPQITTPEGETKPLNEQYKEQLVT